MRLVALAGFVVAALAIALWFLVMRDDSHAAPDAAPAKPPRPTATAPAPSEPTATGTQARRAQNVGAEIKKSLDTARPTPSAGGAAPALAAEGSAGSGSDGPPRPPIYWAMKLAVRQSEPAVIDCLDAAKKAGASVDGTSAFGAYFVRQGSKFVFERSTREYGPYPDALNDCLEGVAKTMTFDDETPGADRIVFFRKLAVENGEITQYSMPQWRITDGAAATPD